MILPDRQVAEIDWPDAEAEARWSCELERACRHLTAFRRAKVRAIVVADEYRGGEAELGAVRALAGELAREYGLDISVFDHGNRLAIRLSRRERTTGG